MKKSKILKITIICFILFSVSLGWANLLRSAEQYVAVFLIDGSSLKFEYMTFMTENFDFPEKMNRVSQKGEIKTFGEKRFCFIHRKGCEKRGINLDNLVEIEILGQVQNACTGKKDWLIKILLFDNEEYEGYLNPSAHNASRVLSQHNIQGILFDTGTESAIEFKDIKKIAFFPM